MAKPTLVKLKPKEVKCLKCGLVCYDEATLKRHMDWAHKEKKDAS